MQKWEYLSISYVYSESEDNYYLFINEELSVVEAGKFKPIEAMKHLGEEGWELVLGDHSFIRHASTTKATLIFKRPIEKPKS